MDYIWSEIPQFKTRKHELRKLGHDRFFDRHA